MRRSVIHEIQGVGPVLFERSYKAKHLNISIRPFKGVRVAVPVGCSFKKAERFVQSKIEWIKRHQKKIKQAELENESILKNSYEINRSEARKILVSRLNELAEKNGFEFGRVFIRCQKTLWGSCSRKNNISLNVQIVRLPDDLRDYVILHELVHTRIKNHSREFWSELDRYVEDAKKMRNKLKEFKIGYHTDLFKSLTR